MCVCVCVLGWYNVQQTQLERDGLWGELCPLPFPLNVYIYIYTQEQTKEAFCQFVCAQWVLISSPFSAASYPFDYITPSLSLAGLCP